MKFKIKYELRNFFQQGMMILVESIKVYNTWFTNSEEGDKWARFSMNMAMVMIGLISDELVIITWHIIIVACTMFTYTHS